MATQTSSQDLYNLTINRVTSPEAFEQMISAGVISANEFYLVEGENETVDWSNITNKPSTFPPEAHSHGNITNAGELSTANRAVVTDSNKKVTVADLSVSSATSESTAANRFVYTVTQDSQGKITVKTRPLPAATDVIKTVTFTAGSTPTLGTAFSIPNVTGNTSVTASKVTKSDNTVVKTISQASSTSSVIGTVANGVLTLTEAITAVGAVTAGSTATASAVTITDVTATNTSLGTAFSVPNVTDVGTVPTLTTTTQSVITGIS